MAIALRGAAQVPTGNPTTGGTVTIPSAVLTDDLLYIVLASRDSTGAGTLSVTDNDTGGNTWSKIGNSTDHKITLWFKRATSGTASKTVTVANAVGSCAFVLKCFSGASKAVTPHTQITVETNAAADETHAGFTPTYGNMMVCCGVVNYANDNAVTSLSFATLGATTATEKLSTGGSDCGAIFGHALQSGAAAATGNLTWAQADGTTYSITWAIKELVAPITADQASFSVTGQDVGLLAGRKLVADQASIAVAGQDVTLTVSAPPFSVDPAVFTVTGQDVILDVTRLLTAEAGSVAVAGQDVGLERQLRLTIDQASYTVAGQDVILDVARQLLADPASIAVAGQDVGLLRGLRLTAQHAISAIQGQDVLLRVGRVLVADQATYTVQGQEVALSTGNTLAAETGLITIAGQDVTFARDLILPIQAAAIAVQGQDAQLLEARRLLAEVAAIAVQGQDVVLKSGTSFAADPGLVSVSGQDVGFQRTRWLLAAMRSLTVTAFPVGLIYEPTEVPPPLRRLTLSAPLGSSHIGSSPISQSAPLQGQVDVDGLVLQAPIRREE